MTTPIGNAQPGDVTVCNFALGHVAAINSIQNLDTDPSPEAVVCRQFYYAARDEVLRAFDWGFATKFAQLGLVQNYPTNEYSYAYRYPSDCLKFRRICSGLRTDNRQSRVTFKLSQDSQGLIILTDWQNVIQTPPNPVLIPDCEYTFQAYNASFWPTDFIQALSWKLSFYIAPQLARGDSFQLRDQALANYTREIQKAQAEAANEQQVDVAPESEMIRAREGVWVYPYWDNENYQNLPGGYPIL